MTVRAAQALARAERLEAAADRRIVRALAEIEMRLGHPIDPSDRVDNFSHDTLIDLLDAGYSVDECVQKMMRTQCSNG